MKQIYFIGGSPCSGKSSIAQLLEKRVDVEYFKIDDHLEKYMQFGVGDKKPVCLKHQTLNTDEIWMRSPIVQAEEELQFYDEIFEYIMGDIKELSASKHLIVEGAALKPNLMQQLGVAPSNYLCIVPSYDFQIKKYQEREWVHGVIGQCRNPKRAFENWMERDRLFAEEIKKMCEKYRYTFFVTDGTKTIDEVEKDVIAHFEL